MPRLLLHEAEKIDVARHEEPTPKEYSFNSNAAHHSECKHTTIHVKTSHASAVMEHCPKNKILHLHTIDSNEGSSPIHAHKVLGSWFKEAVRRPHDVNWVSADVQNEHFGRFIKNMGARKQGPDRWFVKADVMRSSKYRRLASD